MSAKDPTIYRFGVFEFDSRTAELRKNGVRLKLQDQPSQVLLKLLECSGELVTREELRSILWPKDTFVDFENGLNTAVKRLRDALGEAAEAPMFIETMARRGYRFIAPVSTRKDAAEASLSPDASGQRIIPSPGTFARHTEEGQPTAVIDGLTQSPANDSLRGLLRGMPGHSAENPAGVETIRQKITK